MAAGWEQWRAQVLASVAAAAASTAAKSVLAVMLAAGSAMAAAASAGAPAASLAPTPAASPTAQAGAVVGVAAPAASDPALEARVMKVSAELRCLVCQNQTIADSNADLAVDLRNQVREMLRRGDTPTQVTDYMTARYGDFVLYRPPVKGSTLLLWFGPVALLIFAVAVLAVVVRRRARLPAERFEPDPEGG